MNRKLSKTLVMAAAVCMTFTLTGCSNGNIQLPVNELPAEFSESLSGNINAVSSVTLSNEVSDTSLSNPNSILMQNDISVYYDNTTGCFMEYVNLNKKDPNNLAYQMFSKTMKSFKDTFDSAKSYKTYTLQKESDGILSWQDFSKDVFLNFGSLDTYTYNVGGKFADDDSPINMWVRELKTNSGSNSVSVYISDLNEQNGLLTQSGKELKELLEADPEKDLLIISYVLPFKGTISSPTAENEGNGKSQVDDKKFDDIVDRNYYAVAYGSRETLTALANAVRQNFSEIGLEMDVFMYHTSFYTEDRTETAKSGGEVIDADFVKNTPPVYSILDGDGSTIEAAPPQEQETEPAEPEEEESPEDALLGGKKKKDNGAASSSSSGSGLANLDILTDVSQYINANITGTVYRFRTLIPSMGNKESAFSIKLDNADTYTLDTENASVYRVNTSGGALEESVDEAQKLWLKESDLSSIGAKVSFGTDTVKVEMSSYLENNNMFVISIPVKFSYSQEHSVTELVGIPPEYEQLFEKCKVPDIITDSNIDEKFTKTYGFDSFMDKLTGYKAIISSGNNPLVVNESHEKEEFEAVVDRLNVVVVPQDAEK